MQQGLPKLHVVHYIFNNSENNCIVMHPFRYIFKTNEI